MSGFGPLLGRDIEQSSGTCLLAVAFLLVACGGGDTGTDVEDDSDLPVVSTVTVSPATLTLTEGDTGRVTVRAQDQNGSELSTAGVVWSSGDSEIATVDAGVIRAIRPGTVTIRARLGGVTGSAELRVSAFEEPQPLLQGDTMVGYLAPGARDSIGLDVPEDERVQYHGSASLGDLTMVLRRADGRSRGMLAIEGPGVWYSAVYIGGAPAYFIVELRESATVGEHYTFAVDAIDTLPEVAPEEIEAGDTIRGELLGPPNGDRDVFVVPGGPDLSALIHVRFAAEWEGRTLFVRGVGDMNPAGAGAWVTGGPFAIPAEENRIEFLVPQPWGREFSLPLEFVVEIVDGG